MVALKGTATIGMDDARTLRIQPFDPSLAKDIERAISAANLGVGTSSDGHVIRVTFPELTGERRAELVKVAKGKLEDARTTVRLARDESWKVIQEREREGTLTEDDKFALKEDLQELVDKSNENLEKMFKAKETEMTS
jgi:ribosome recycling factor